VPETLTVVKATDRSDRVKRTHERRKQVDDPFEVGKDLGDVNAFAKVGETRYFFLVLINKVYYGSGF
jgi:hypothetical protein